MPETAQYLDKLLAPETNDNLTVDDHKDIQTINNFLKKNIAKQEENKDFLTKKLETKNPETEKNPAKKAYNSLKNKIWESIKFVDDHNMAALDNRFNINDEVSKENLSDITKKYDRFFNRSDYELSKIFNHEMLNTIKDLRKGFVKMSDTPLEAQEIIKDNTQKTLGRWKNLKINACKQDITSISTEIDNMTILDKSNIQNLELGQIPVQTKILTTQKESLNKYKENLVEKASSLKNDMNLIFLNIENSEDILNQIKQIENQLASSLKIIENKQNTINQNINKLNQKDEELQYEKYNISLAEGKRYTLMSTKLDLSEDSIWFYRNVTNILSLHDGGMYKVKDSPLPAIKNYFGENSKNLKVKLNSKEIALSDLTEDNLKNWDKDFFLTMFNFEHLPTREQCSEDSTILRQHNLVFNQQDHTKTNRIKKYMDTKKTQGLSGYGKAIKQKVLKEIRTKIPSTHIENTYLEITNWFKDKLHSQLKKKPTSYVWFDWKIYGWWDNTVETNEKPDPNRLRDHIKKDFAILASKYQTYDDFKSAIDSDKTGFSWKDNFTEANFQKLYNYIKHWAPTADEKYNFTQFWNSGQCKEIKELQKTITQK